jgi:hypothetical protein
MPTYKFKCENNHIKELFMSINDFIMRDKIKCDLCGENLEVYISSVVSKVEKSTDQILADIDEDVKKTVEKYLAGDPETVEDISGGI